MFRGKHLITLLVGMFVFASTASAQGSGCPQLSCPAVKKQTPKCEPAPAQRQKPYAGMKPARVTAPKEAERAADAARVIDDFPNKGTIRDAKAIAVIPGVKKA